MALYWAKAIDISTWQESPDIPGDIDWTKPKANAVHLIINRATFSDQVDSDFSRNWAAEKEHGYLRGGYGFWDYRPGNPGALAQAKAFVRAMKPDPGEFPVVWGDFERPNFQWPVLPPRLDVLSAIETYTKTISDGLGMQSGVYLNPAMIQYLCSANGVLVDLPDWLRELALWVAAWPSVPAGETLEGYIERTGWRPNIYGQWRKWLIWQAGIWDGIKMGQESKEVDADFVNMTEAELVEYCNEKTEVNPMWTENALIAAFDKIADNAEPATVDFSALKAAGVHAVLLRCGTSGSALNYDQPDASYLPNTKYGAWFRAATAAGLRVLIDYDFNAMLDSVNGYNGSVTLRHINQVISGGLKPVKGGAMFLNLERNTWTESSKPKTCTANMFSQDVQNTYNTLWGTHGLVAGIRTGRWFLDKTDESGTTYKSQMEWMDKGEATIPLFLARPKINGTLVSGDLHNAISAIADPAITYVKVGNVDVNEQAYFLYFGNKTKWSGWEIAWLKHAAVKDAAGSPALFRLILWTGKPAHFDTYFNYPAINTDLTPPTVPAGLASSVSGGNVVLTWMPSTDNVGALGYQVYRNGAKVMAITGTSVSFSGQLPGTYVFGVAAFDAAGNESAPATLSVVVPQVAVPITRAEFDALVARVAEVERWRKS
jgi:GH25 family lysozyme M1 (1,4-beta-N-acetylmuramidase)